MRIGEIRSSFTVFVIASRVEKTQGIGSALGAAGYMLASFTELTAAFSELASNPPHFVVFDFKEERFELAQAIRQVQSQLPETHILVAVPWAEREAAVSLLERGVYDLIYLPTVHEGEITARFDHAAERDYMMYLNERLMEGAPELGRSALQGPAFIEEPPSPNASDIAPTVSMSARDTIPEDFTTLFLRELFELRTPDECLQLYLETVAGSLGGVRAVYFKYFSNRRVLAAVSGHNLQGLELQGLGIDFNQEGSHFRAAHLRDPESIPELRSLSEEVFDSPKFLAKPIQTLGEIQGVAMFFTSELSNVQRDSVEVCTEILMRVIGLQEAQKRLHSVSVKDAATDVYTRTHFIARSIEEVARARRTNLPVSMVILAVDQFGQLVSEFGPEEGNTVLRMFIKIIEKHSRLNDIVGRLGSDEFGILLPHTGLKGALIKAERLRRIIESADFSKVLGAAPTLTVSIGVSEYPSFCRDADELLQTADEALFHIREHRNKVCAAKAPVGFVADFEVREKGL